MPALLFQFLTVAADVIIFITIGYYILKFREREKKIEKSENKTDTEYHKIVDDALSRERKIIDDATDEAKDIITKTEYLSKTSRQAIDDALNKIVDEIKIDSEATAKEFTSSYKNNLKSLMDNSLSDFQNLSKELESDLQKQVKEFHDKLLPNLQKELEEYKELRMKKTEEAVVHIVQEASQEILNKSLSIPDHQKIVIDSLEKAKKEGVFE